MIQVISQAEFNLYRIDISRPESKMKGSGITGCNFTEGIPDMRLENIVIAIPGIELNQIGIAVAIIIYPDHPGDLLIDYHRSKVMINRRHSHSTGFAEGDLEQ